MIKKSCSIAGSKGQKAAGLRLIALVMLRDE